MNNEFLLGPISDIPVNDYKVFELEAIDILVCNINGKYRAVSNYCPHAGAFLGRGPLDKNHIICPGHGYRFDVTTGECLDDKELRLTVFNLIHKGDMLYISFDNEAIQSK